jgi:hypothetical protein
MAVGGIKTHTKTTWTGRNSSGTMRNRRSAAASSVHAILRQTSPPPILNQSPRNGCALSAGRARPGDGLAVPSHRPRPFGGPDLR